MARTGSSTIISAARTICKMVGVYGAGDLATRTTPAFKLAVDALVAACLAFEALDDHPGEVDATEPFTAEDVPPMGP